jgi:hypothetical protein
MNKFLLSSLTPGERESVGAASIPASIKEVNCQSGASCAEKIKKRISGVSGPLHPGGRLYTGKSGEVPPLYSTSRTTDCTHVMSQFFHSWTKLPLSTEKPIFR